MLFLTKQGSPQRLLCVPTHNREPFVRSQLKNQVRAKDSENDTE